jgi:hypothetical protein
MSNNEEVSDAENNRSDKAIIEHREVENPKAIKAAEELQKEERESEQLVVDPEQVLEEEEKRQPQSLEE